MDKSFAISAVRLKISLKNEFKKSQSGLATYIINNKNRVALAGKIKIVPLGDSKLEWFYIDDRDRDRVYHANETHTIPITISVPYGVPQGKYQFRIDLQSEGSSETNSLEGQIIEFSTDSDSVLAYKWKWVLIASASAVVIGIIAAFNFTIAFKVKVPDLIGIPYITAIDTLQKIGLSPQVVTDFLPSDTNEWIIKCQKPLSGVKVNKKRTVLLTIQEGVVVPDVIGKTEIIGKGILESKGFITSKISVKNGNGPLGCIVQIRPSVGTVTHKGKKIEYVVKE